MTARLGIIGGGQLGCMLYQAARELGLSVVISDPDPNAPATRLDGFLPAADWPEAVRVLTAAAGVLTWEREDLPLEVLAGGGSWVWPSQHTLSLVQDRGIQKRLYDALALPTADWLPADAPAQIPEIEQRLGYPLMVKARRGGFDGRGQIVAKDQAGLAAAIEAFAGRGAIAERMIAFDDECAVLLTRGGDGRVVHYPLVWTHQRDGQLDWALAPHPLSATLEAPARAIAAVLAKRLDHVGTLAVECFRCGERLLVNELAPRVHNSGHWTIEGCSASQFENHVRAVCGMPLVEPESRGASLMLNCIGTMPPTELTAGLARHDYGKQARPGRKVGHLVLQAPDAVQALARAAALPASLRKDRRLPVAGALGSRSSSRF